MVQLPTGPALTITLLSDPRRALFTPPGRFQADPAFTDAADSVPTRPSTIMLPSGTLAGTLIDPKALSSLPVMVIVVGYVPAPAYFSVRLLEAVVPSSSNWPVVESYRPVPAPVSVSVRPPTVRLFCGVPGPKSVLGS